MYRMGLMALIAPDIPGIDRDKLVFFFFSFSHSNELHLKKKIDGSVFFFFFFSLNFICIHFRCIKMAIVHDIAEGIFIQVRLF